MAQAWRIGSYGTDDMTGKVVKLLTTLAFSAIGAGAIAGNLLLAGANYQVTAAKVLHITGFTIQATGATTAGAYFEIRYADNAALTTNPVSVLTLPNITGAYNLSQFVACGDVQVPAGKYLGVWNPSGSASGAAAVSIQTIGYEV